MITDETEISPGNSSRVADRKRGIAELGSMAAAIVEQRLLESTRCGERIPQEIDIVNNKGSQMRVGRTDTWKMSNANNVKGETPEALSVAVETGGNIEGPGSVSVLSMQVLLAD